MASGQAAAVSPAASHAPPPQAGAKSKPKGDLFDALVEAMSNHGGHSILGRLGVPAESAARLVPIATDALSHPEDFWPQDNRDPSRTSMSVSDRMEWQTELLDFLWELGPLSAGSSQALISLMNSENVADRVRVQAASTLVHVTGQADPGIPFLTQAMLRDEVQATDALGMLGPVAASAAASLSGIMNAKDKDTESRAHAAAALVRVTGKSDPGIPFLLRLLKEPVPEAPADGTAPAPTGASRPDRDIALEVLVKLGPQAGDAVAEMTGLLHSSQVPLALRISIAAALITIEGKPDPGMPVLCSLLKDPSTDDPSLSAIFGVLEDLGPEASDAAPAIAEQLRMKHDDSFPPWSAALALKAILTPPVLAKLMPADYLDEEADYVLAEADDPGPLVHLQILRLDGKTESGASACAAEILAGLGPNAELAVPSLRGVLAGDRTGPKIAAASALVHITGDAEPGVSTLAGLLSDPSVGVSLSAVDALGDLGPKANGAVPALARMADDGKSDPQLKAAAAWALVRISGKAETGTAALGDLLANPDPAVEVFALERLTDLGPTAAGALPALGVLLGSEGTNPRVRLLAVAAAAELGGPTGDQVSQLAKLVRQPGNDRLVRVEALKQLGELGPKAADAIPDLGLVLNASDEDTSLKIHAASALARIEGKPGFDALLALFHSAVGSGDTIADPESLALVVAEMEDYATMTWAAADLRSLGANASVPDGKLKAVAQAALFRTAENPHDSLSHRLDRMLSRNHLLSRRLPRMDEGGSGESDEQVQKDSIGALAALLHKAGDGDTVAAAAQELGNLGDRAADAAPSLLDVLGAPGVDPHVQICAATAWIRIAGDKGPGIPVLEKNLLGSASNECVLRLGDLGPLAAKAAPELLALRDNSTDPETVRAIDVALSRIRNARGL